MSLNVPCLAPRGPEGLAPGCSPAAAMGRLRSALADAPAVTIALNDPQRGTRSAAVLAGLTDLACARRARLLVATGTHRFNLPERRDFEAGLLAALPGAAVAWNDCHSQDRLALGEGEGAWHAHPWLLDRDRALLAIGSSEPHYFAGVTGAHKTVTIGCAAHADIEANHALSLSPAARAGALAGNPVHEGIAAMAAALQARRPVLAVNLFQIGSDVLAAAAGDPLEALDRIAPLVRSAYFRTIPSPADALVLEADGPLGETFYQAQKAITNSEWAVRDGGALVLSAALSGGVGQDNFLRLLREHRRYAPAMDAVRSRGYRLADQKALKLRHLTDRRGVRVYVVSAGLPAADAEVLGLLTAPSVEAALAAAGVDPSRHAVYRVLDAGNTCTAVGGQNLQILNSKS